MHGEVGQTQFMQKSILQLGVGNLDIASGALTSTANFLKAHGWRAAAGLSAGRAEFRRKRGMERCLGLSAGDRAAGPADRRPVRSVEPQPRWTVAWAGGSCDRNVVRRDGVAGGRGCAGSPLWRSPPRWPWRRRSSAAGLGRESRVSEYDLERTGDRSRAHAGRPSAPERDVGGGARDGMWNSSPATSCSCSAMRPVMR